MKYYIPTSSLNFNNILSTESVSPKIFYGKRGFGYSRWFTIEENNIEHLSLLYDSPHMFERPKSDIEDHPMLIEIDIDEDFPKMTDGVFYTDRTIYLNPWQTKFIFFCENDKKIALSLSDSSLETKLVRLYQKRICVKQFEGMYPKIHLENSIPVGNTDSLIEEDYVLNKMKGLLYGYYIGANLSSTKEQVQKLDTLREILNIFSSVLSSLDKIPTNTQSYRLNELFDYLDSQQPIFADLEEVVGDKQVVGRIFSVFKRYGYVFTSIDRTKLIHGLQNDIEDNLSLTWVNSEIARTKALMMSSNNKLDPDMAEIIVSVKDKVVAPKVIEDNIMSNLFVCWVNDVLCSKSFNGKINSIKEKLSDELTISARNMLAERWESSPIRAYLNQLRRHVRGEEFNPQWDNSVLSSIAAVLIKGDDWEQLLNFMQSKGMYDYRIAFAIYGVLNGFANMTRDFTDLLLNAESNYLSKVYREIYGQLLEKDIPNMANTSPTIDHNGTEMRSIEDGKQNILLRNLEENNLLNWQNEIRKFAVSVIKRDKQKLLNSLEDAFDQNGNNQDYFIFITMLDNFEGWKPGKNGPSKAWARLQEHYVPDYKQRISKPAKKQSQSKKTAQQEKGLFDGVVDGLQNVAQTVINASAREEDKASEEGKKNNIFSPENVQQAVSRVGKSILDDKAWINECAFIISDLRARRQFLEDMEWFVGNHMETYKDKKKGVVVKGYYAGQNCTNGRVIERLKIYMENKLNQRNEKMRWLAQIYEKIPISYIIDYISKLYGI